MPASPGDSRASPRRYILAASLAGVVCASFAAVASWVVLAMQFAGAFTEESGFAARMLVKAVFFTLFAIAGAIWILRRRVPAQSHSPDATPRPGFRWELVAIVAIAALVFFPRLDKFPSAQPDELHHLIVARNLGLHGAYASGLAPDRLIHFDRYDSVGPTVIGPVAATLRWAGADVATGRIPMAALALAFPVAIYLLFAPWGRPAASLAALTTLGAFGTVYLSRTLYGEVPALTFFVFGLVVWRRSIYTASVGLAFAAGLLFGLAVITKAFLVLAAFAFLGAFFLDRISARRIRLVTIPATALGAVLPILAWWSVEFLARDLVAEQPSLLVYYRHMLVFGLGTDVERLAGFWNVFLTFGFSLLFLGIIIPNLLHYRSDLSLMVLLLAAVLFAFWWCFFTPMHIPRYLWYTSAIAAGFGGGKVGRELRAVKSGMVPSYATAALALALCVAYAVPFARVGARVYTADQSVSDRELVSIIEDLPEDTPLFTDHWPVERLINFTAERAVEVTNKTKLPRDAVLIATHERDRAHDPIAVPPRQVGNYLLYFTNAQLTQGP